MPCERGVGGIVPSYLADDSVAGASMMNVVGELRAELESAEVESRVLLARLTEADLARETDNERWSVREHLVHLVISEPGLCGTIRGALRDEWVVPEDFDLDRWNQRQVERNKDLPLAELRDRIVANRVATLALLGELAEADLAREARHASLRVMTLAEFFRVIVAHQREHLGVIERALPGSRFNVQGSKK